MNSGDTVNFNADVVQIAYMSSCSPQFGKGWQLRTEIHPAQLNSSVQFTRWPIHPYRKTVGRDTGHSTISRGSLVPSSTYDGEIHENSAL